MFIKRCLTQGRSIPLTKIKLKFNNPSPFFICKIYFKILVQSWDVIFWFNVQIENVASICLQWSCVWATALYISNTTDAESVFSRIHCTVWSQIRLHILIWSQVFQDWAKANILCTMNLFQSIPITNYLFSHIACFDSNYRISWVVIMF